MRQTLCALAKEKQNNNKKKMITSKCLFNAKTLNPPALARNQAFPQNMIIPHQLAVNQVTSCGRHENSHIYIYVNESHRERMSLSAACCKIL